MVIGMSVCILCLYVHPLVYHRNHMSDLTIFSVHVACGYIISNGNTCTLCISRVVTTFAHYGQAQATTTGHMFKVTHQGAAPRTQSTTV